MWKFSPNKYINFPVWGYKMDCNNQVNMTPSPLLSTLKMFFSSPCPPQKIPHLIS